MSESSILSLGLVVIALVGWLVRRSVGNLDDSIKKLDSKNDALANNLDTKIERVDAKQDLHMAAVSRLENKHVEHEVRLVHVERNVQVMDARHRDMAGFLQSRGFRKSDPPKDGDDNG